MTGTLSRGNVISLRGLCGRRKLGFMKVVLLPPAIVLVGRHCDWLNRSELLVLQHLLLKSGGLGCQ